MGIVISKIKIGFIPLFIVFPLRDIHTIYFKIIYDILKSILAIDDILEFCVIHISDIICFDIRAICVQHIPFKVINRYSKNRVIDGLHQ